MKYMELSKETLIHELKQVSKELEITKMKLDSKFANEANIFDSLSIGAIVTDSDYSITWANKFILGKKSDVIGTKCYSSLYGLNDICKGCPREVVSLEKINKSIYVEVNNFGIKETRENSLYYLKDVDEKMVFELQKKADGKNDELQLMKENAVKHENLMNEKDEYFRNVKKYLDKISRDIKFPASEIVELLNMFRLDGKEANIDNNYDIIEKVALELLDTSNKLDNLLQTGNVEFRSPIIEFNIYDEIKKITRLLEITNDNKFKVSIYKSTPKIILGDKVQILRLIKIILMVTLRMGDKGNISIEMYDIKTHDGDVDFRINLSNDDIVDTDSIRFLKNSGKNLLHELENEEHFERFIEKQLIDNLLERIDGEVEIRNSMKNNVKIELSLPLKSTINTKTNIEKEKNIKGKKTILISNKNKIIFTSEIYKNYNVVFVKNGEEITEYYRKYKVAIVFIDIMCEDTNGFAILDILKNNNTDDTIFIAVAKQILENEKEFYQEYGFNDHLKVPFVRNDIEKMIKHYGEHNY